MSNNDSLGFYRGAQVEVMPRASYRPGQIGRLTDEVRDVWRVERIDGWLVRFADGHIGRYHNDWLRRC